MKNFLSIIFAALGLFNLTATGLSPNAMFTCSDSLGLYNWCNPGSCARLFSGLPSFYTNTQNAASAISRDPYKNAHYIDCICSLQKDWCTNACQTLSTNSAGCGGTCATCLDACTYASHEAKQSNSPANFQGLPISENFYKNYQTIMRLIFPPHKDGDLRNIDYIRQQLTKAPADYLRQHSNDGMAAYHMFQLVAAAQAEANDAVDQRVKQISDIMNNEQTKTSALTKAHEIIDALTQQNATWQKLLTACKNPSAEVPGVPQATTASIKGLSTMSAAATPTTSDWCSKFSNNKDGGWTKTCCTRGWHTCALQYAIMQYDLPNTKSALEVLKTRFDDAINRLKKAAQEADDFTNQIDSLNNEIAQSRKDLETCITGT